MASMISDCLADASFERGRRLGDGLDFRLLNDFQRDFPLCARPFARVARRLGCSEAQVIRRLEALRASGAVGRVGAVFSPRRIGASTLAALKVAPSRLAEVAALVSGLASVNHNYAREHSWNLWFVATAPDSVALARTLREIRRETRCPLIVLPLLTEYHIDLGFDLTNGERTRSVGMRPVTSPRMPERAELALMAALEGGLPLLCRPFAAIARRAGMHESQVIAMLRGWLAEGTLKRFGVVVRHHELGYRANAMCVWNVPDERADALGMQLADCAGVNLCYLRRRAGGRWPYNLYCMIHGRDRASVRERIAQVGASCGLDGFDASVLFSTRRFKQRGASYLAAVADG